jgi:hypothetical protein
MASSRPLTLTFDARWVVHEGVACDRSGVRPIIGPRYSRKAGEGKQSAQLLNIDVWYARLPPPPPLRCPPRCMRAGLRVPY